MTTSKGAYGAWLSALSKQARTRVWRALCERGLRRDTAGAGLEDGEFDRQTAGLYSAPSIRGH